MRAGGTNDRAGAARTRPAPSSAAPPMNRRLTFQVHRVNAKIAQVANPLFRIQQLDLLSSRILVLLLERGEMRVGELVEEMVLPQSTISHQLQRLEKRKLLRRRRVKDDNRAVAVSLTRKGLEVARQCNQLSLDPAIHDLWRERKRGCAGQARASRRLTRKQRPRITSPRPSPPTAPSSGRRRTTRSPVLPSADGSRGIRRPAPCRSTDAPR
jgi:DNA-binding MarR family transcriptional regulator